MSSARPALKTSSKDAELDAVVIATPVRHHFAMAKASLLAGKHTLIEKPMASSSAECEELIAIARQKGLVLMVGHTFLYSAAVRKIKEIVDHNDIGEIRYISARRLNLGLFQKDINVAWDLAPHDLSIILHIMEEMPYSINCRGAAHVTPGIEDVTSMTLQFTKQRSAIIQSSWLDPRKIREMTIVGSKRMIVYDDVAPQEKIKIFDVRVERPPHYDTFARIPVRLPLRRYLLPAHQAGRAAQDRVPAFRRLHQARDRAADVRIDGTGGRQDPGGLLGLREAGRHPREPFAAHRGPRDSRARPGPAWAERRLGARKGGGQGTDAVGSGMNPQPEPNRLIAPDVKLGQKRPDLRVHQPLRMRDRRRLEDRHIRGDPEGRKDRRPMQDLQPQLHLRGRDARG